MVSPPEPPISGPSWSGSGEPPGGSHDAVRRSLLDSGPKFQYAFVYCEENVEVCESGLYLEVSFLSLTVRYPSCPW